MPRNADTGAPQYKIEQTQKGTWRVFAEAPDNLGFLVLCEVSTELEAQRRLAEMQHNNGEQDAE